MFLYNFLSLFFIMIPSMTAWPPIPELRVHCFIFFIALYYNIDCGMYKMYKL